ncbi:MAG: histidine phosphatase family protein [Proteobacteria bacterium]|nr:histidine phosphatase family protein [Pseudomonadota bacterium]
MQGLKKHYTFLILAIALISFSKVDAIPRTVILIRHGEKVPDENYLSVKGLERAGALPYYFSNTSLYNNPPITYIFAAGQETPTSSVRPIQTCKPTADFYKLPLNTNFKPYQTSELAKELLTNSIYDNTTVLICWSHGHIGQIVTDLGAENPGKWKHDIFDQVYLVSFDNGKASKVQTIMQKLMFGDRSD